MTKLYVVREHHEILSIWREQGRKGLSLLHLDFHDDLRGFLIDRRRNRAYRTGVFRVRQDPLDEGNFLVHAVIEGIVGKIRWVRGRIGGRAFETGIVKYREDLASFPHRFGHLLRRDGEYSLTFSESLDEDLEGLEESEHLDMDWDFFASLFLSPSGIEERFDAFLRRIEGSSPPAIYLSYSPDHVHPSGGEFLRAIAALSTRYQCEPLWPGSNFVADLPTTPPSRKPPSPLPKLLLALRKKGFY